LKEDTKDFDWLTRSCIAPINSFRIACGWWIDRLTRRSQESIKSGWSLWRRTRRNSIC